jgi:hypothetical protein
MQSGPQGRANTSSWDLLAQDPSPPELGEPKAPEGSPEPETEPPAEPTQRETQEPEAEESTKGQKEEEQQQQGEGKKESRYERTKRQRKAFEAQRAEFEAERKAFADNRRAFEEEKRKASEPPYTVKELREYRKKWNNPASKDYDPDLVEKADAEIQRLESLEAESKQVLEIPKSGTKEFVQQWEAAEKELYSIDPEFQREGTRLDKVLRAIMTGPDGNIYRQHPRGIVAAYNAARLGITQSDLGLARTEVNKLKAEVNRLNGLLGIGGGASAGRSIGEFRGKDFSSMSTKEMREHLKSHAMRGNW